MVRPVDGRGSFETGPRAENCPAIYDDRTLGESNPETMARDEGRPGIVAGYWSGSGGW